MVKRVLIPEPPSGFMVQVNITRTKDSRWVASMNGVSFDLTDPATRGMIEALYNQLQGYLADGDDVQVKSETKNLLNHIFNTNG